MTMTHRFLIAALMLAALTAGPAAFANDAPSQPVPQASDPARDAKPEPQRDAQSDTKREDTKWAPSAMPKESGDKVICALVRAPD